MRVETIFLFWSLQHELLRRQARRPATHHRQLLLVLVLLILLHASKPKGHKPAGKGQFYGMLAAVWPASHLSGRLERKLSSRAIVPGLIEQSKRQQCWLLELVLSSLLT